MTYKDPRHLFKADLIDLELFACLFFLINFFLELVSYQVFFLCCLWMTVPALLTLLVQYHKILPIYMNTYKTSHTFSVFTIFQAKSFTRT